MMKLKLAVITCRTAWLEVLPMVRRIILGGCPNLSCKFFRSKSFVRIMAFFSFAAKKITSSSEPLSPKNRKLFAATPKSSCSHLAIMVDKWASIQISYFGVIDIRPHHVKLGNLF